MNEKGNTFLLAGDKLISKTHLRHHGFSYNAYTPIAKNKQIIIQNFIVT